MNLKQLKLNEDEREVLAEILTGEQFNVIVKVLDNLYEAKEQNLLTLFITEKKDTQEKLIAEKLALQGAADIIRMFSQIKEKANKK